MSQDWPGDWISGAEKLAQQVSDKDSSSITNDHGTLYMVDNERSSGSFLWMTDIPERLENRC